MRVRMPVRFIRHWSFVGMLLEKGRTHIPPKTLAGASDHDDFVYLLQSSRSWIDRRVFISVDSLCELSPGDEGIFWQRREVHLNRNGAPIKVLWSVQKVPKF